MLGQAPRTPHPSLADGASEAESQEKPGPPSEEVLLDRSEAWSWAEWGGGAEGEANHSAGVGTSQIPASTWEEPVSSQRPAPSESTLKEE